LKARLLKENLPVASGTRVEIGCVHAEMNVICNAAAGGVKSAGAWLIVTGEPCLQCAKLVHHAGIVHVIVVAGGYAGANGLEYLREHKVRVTEVDGPQDPRLGKAVQSGMCTSSSL
jgi:dCMP deaminase